MDKEKLKENFYKGTITDETLTKANAILVIKCANLEQQCKKQKEVIDKVNEVIDKMINIGYSSDSTQYCATGEGSEFGTRAKIIKDMLKEVSE